MAKPAPAKNEANKPAAAKAASDKVAKPRVAAEVTVISSAVPMPTSARASGNRSPYPFHDLEVGGSFGVKNKTKDDLASIVSNQNRHKSNQQQAKNADGSPAFEMVPMKDANGAVVGMTQGEPKMERIKEWIIADVDPNTDPDGASCRIWRRK